MKTRPAIGICLLLGSMTVLGQQNEKQTYRLSLPSKSWSLDISLAGFTVTSEEIVEGGAVYNLNAAQFPTQKGPAARLMSVSVHMEPVQPGHTAADIRDAATKRATKNETIDQRSLKTLEYGQIPLVMFVIDLAGMGIAPASVAPTSKHKSLAGYFVKDDVAITVAMSGLPFKKEDEKLFYAILDSVKVVDVSSPSTAFDFFQKGRALFLQTNYQAAIEPLSKAFGLERREAQLLKNDWRELVLDLANSYGAVGNKSAFGEILQYGINQDPTYYRFYFTQARMDAAEGKLDETIASLENAFRYRQADIQASKSTEPLPDPLFDPAFERFRKDDKFRKAVKAMKK